MRFLKSILLFCIEKWGFKKNSFVTKNLFLCIILKNYVFEVNSFVLYWKMINENFLKLFPKKFAFLCIILKNEGFKSILLFYIERGFLKTLFRKCYILMYYIEKWCFWSQFFCFVLKNEDFKKLFCEKIIFLCVILKNDVFEVSFFVLYWKMRNENFSTLFPKKCYILMYYIEKWGFWSQFFCFILKNENF